MYPVGRWREEEELAAAAGRSLPLLPRGHGDDVCEDGDDDDDGDGRDVLCRHGHQHVLPGDASLQPWPVIT